MNLERLTHGLIYVALTASSMAGCASDGMVQVDGGSLSTCTAPAISRPAPCGVVDGQPFYAFYDGCNWCQCPDENGPICTARACQPNEPVVFFFDFNLPGTPTQGETWACDEGGRLFRSACLPDGPTIPCSEVTYPPQLEW